MTAAPSVNGADADPVSPSGGDSGSAAGVVPACGVWCFPNRPTTELVAAIEQAERLALDEFWIGDEGPAREPFAVLAAAAARTSSIRLAIGITNPYVRHPAVAMASAATVSELAPGRVVLGVGAGGAMSLDPFELDAERPVAAVRRFVDIARAGVEARPTEGYRPSDLSVAAVAPAVPIFIGARGPRLNRLASEIADGAFVAGMPPFRFDEVIGWNRTERDIDIALYPSVAFGERGRDEHRAEMIWSLLDAPVETLHSFDVDPDDVAAAAAAVRRGDAGPAEALIHDRLLDELLVSGTPGEVGRRLADLVERHRPSSIGAAIVSTDLERAIDDAATAFSHLHTALEARGWESTWSA